MKNEGRKDPKTLVQILHYKIAVLVSYAISPAKTEFRVGHAGCGPR